MLVLVLVNVIMSACNRSCRYCEEKDLARSGLVCSSFYRAEKRIGSKKDFFLSYMHARDTDYYDTYDLIPFLLLIEQLFSAHAVR